MDMMAALRLQIEWGADEALEDAPVNRMVARAAAPNAVRAVPERPLLERPAMQPLVKPWAKRVATPASSPVQRAQQLAESAATREELRAALTGFDGCALSATATNLVFADGNPVSGLMLIGEGPGAEEDRTGTPFVGAAGQLLDRMMASVGLDRTQCLITNLLPWRPPGNRNPTDSEMRICLPFVLRHIALVQPRRLVLLGAFATNAILGGKGSITRLRGRWAEAVVPGITAPIAALPMLHPAYLLRNGAAKREAWADWLALRRSIDSDV